MATATPERSRRAAPKMRTVDVTRISQLSPNMVSITFAGPELEGFSIAGPTGHLKLFLPHVGENEIDFEALALPRGSRPPSAPMVRTLTPRRFDESSGELDVEFYVHGEGPASSFATNARVGDRIALSGPSRPYLPNVDMYQIIAGDESAVPAIGMIVEALAESTEGLVILELGDSADTPKLQTPIGIVVQTVLRTTDAPVGTAMVAAIRDSELPAGPVQAWVAGESVAIRKARAVLAERNVPRELLTTRGYWRNGEAGHSDHDMGDD